MRGHGEVNVINICRTEVDPYHFFLKSNQVSLKSHLLSDCSRNNKDSSSGLISTRNG